MRKDTLYFDGACPLCRAEIRRLARHTAGRLELVDVHALQDFTGLPGKYDLLARLHLLTAEGTWLTGLDANVRAWHHTRWRKAWAALQLPLVRNVAHAGYDLWLKNRARNACRYD